MSRTHQRLAVLLFANSSQEELKHKYIREGHKLFNYFTERTVSEVRKTGLPFKIYTEKEQKGNSFGERFANAIEDLFNAGYEKIITIGNDSPDLKASDLIETSQYLSAKKLVIGPSTDGGIYLMGIHKTSYNRRSFLGLPWQTKSLAKALAEFSPDKSTKILRRLRDVDSIADLKWFLHTTNTVSKKFKHILSLVFSSPIATIFSRKTFVPSLSFSLLHNKGSPF